MIRGQQTPDIDYQFDLLTGYIDCLVEDGHIKSILGIRIRDHIEWLRQAVSMKLGDEEE